jgi:hypothetical protein
VTGFEAEASVSRSTIEELDNIPSGSNTGSWDLGKYLLPPLEDMQTLGSKEVPFLSGTHNRWLTVGDGWT